MAVSFTAEYLYQGAKYLTRDPHPAAVDEYTPCRERLFIAGRGVYTLGVVVVAPVGVIYHIFAAAQYELRARVGAEDPRELREYVWQHLNAALKDLMGFGSIAYPLLMVALVVGALVLAQPFLLSGPALLLFMEYVFDIRFENYALPYAYAVRPVQTFGFFLSDQRTENGDPSQIEIYSAYWMIRNRIREGAALDGPITEDEARAWVEGIRTLESAIASPVDKMMVMPTLQVRYNREPTPDGRSNLERFIAARSSLDTAWLDTRREQLIRGSLDNTSLKSIFRRHCEHLGPQFIGALEEVWERI